VDSLSEEETGGILGTSRTSTYGAYKKGRGPRDLLPFVQKNSTSYFQ